jgi:sugar/nucleoside kinase (ribokinase family)
MFYFSRPKVRGFSELSNIFDKNFQMKKILGIGNALVDVMTMINDDSILERFSLPKGSMQLVDMGKSEMVKAETVHFNRIMTSGGSAANTIHGLAMLGTETGFIGSVGKDDTGDFFENDMKRAGVNTFLFRRETVTGTAVALISADSERTFATHLGAAVELHAGELKEENFKPYDILYLEGYLINDRQLVEEACKKAKKNRMEIALDLASFNVVDTNLESFRDIISNYVDIIFANEEEARSFTGQDPETALKNLASEGRTAIVKTGREGSLIMRGEELIRIGVLPVKCLDTTGAGDLYAAGFLHGYSLDLDLDKCGLLGALLAGNVIEVVGARLENIRWEHIKNRITEIIGS